MHMRTKALVLRAVDYKESDKILTLLTQESGKLTASARGCRKKGSPVAPGVQLLAWSDLVLYEYRGRWTVKEAAVEREFLGLRRDVERLALALLLRRGGGGAGGGGRAGARSLLSPGAQQPVCPGPDAPEAPGLVKAAFELRLMCAAGYEPSWTAAPSAARNGRRSPASTCGRGRSTAPNAEAVWGRGSPWPVSPPVLAAMRHVVCGDARRLFSFRLDSGALEELAGVSEAYLLTQLERGFRTLDFYKQMTLPAGPDR